MILLKEARGGPPRQHPWVLVFTRTLALLLALALAAPSPALALRTQEITEKDQPGASGGLEELTELLTTGNPSDLEKLGPRLAATTVGLSAAPIAPPVTTARPELVEGLAAGLEEEPQKVTDETKIRHGDVVFSPGKKEPYYLRQYSGISEKERYPDSFSWEAVPLDEWGEPRDQVRELSRGELKRDGWLHLPNASGIQPFPVMKKISTLEQIPPAIDRIAQALSPDYPDPKNLYDAGLRRALDKLFKAIVGRKVGKLATFEVADWFTRRTPQNEMYAVPVTFLTLSICGVRTDSGQPFGIDNYFLDLKEPLGNRVEIQRVSRGDSFGKLWEDLLTDFGLKEKIVNRGSDWPEDSAIVGTTFLIDAAGLEEGEGLEALVAGAGQGVEEAAASGNRFLVTIDPTLVEPGLTGAGLEEIGRELRGLNRFPAVWVRIAGEPQAADETGYDVIVRLVPNQLSAVASADTIYVEPFAPQQPVPQKLLPLLITQALATWQGAQGKILDKPLVIDVTVYYRGVNTLTQEEIYQVLTLRFT